MVKWLDDNLCKTCHDCNVPFSFFRRKHHCRLCGLIFCYKCILDKSISFVKTKICHKCNNQRKDYISYLLEQLNKKDYTIIYLKNKLHNKTIKSHINNQHTNQNIIQQNNTNLIQQDNNLHKEQLPKKNKFNIAEYLTKFK